jgi:hypothetical protein
MVVRPFIAAQADTPTANWPPANRPDAACLPVAHLPDEPVSLGAASPLRAALLAQVGATSCERVVMAARCPRTGRPMVLARFGAADFLMTPADADHQARVLDTECLPGKPGHALALQISSQLWNAACLCHAVEQHANAHSSPLGGGGPSPKAMVEGVPNDPEPLTTLPLSTARAALDLIVRERVSVVRSFAVGPRTLDGVLDPATIKEPDIRAEVEAMDAIITDLGRALDAKATPQ